MIANAEVSAAILKLAKDRGADKTICPSEVARYLGGPDEAVWRPLMEPVRMAACKLAKQGEVKIKKGGDVVDPATLIGIYRIGISED